MSATMRDVARLAGVSVKTVSNVVNDFPHVSVATRSRVLAAISELGYQMNFSARNGIPRELTEAATIDGAGHGRIFLTDPDMYTVPVALRMVVDADSDSSWGALCADSVVSLVRGIATTGLK